MRCNYIFVSFFFCPSNAFLFYHFFTVILLHLSQFFPLCSPPPIPTPAPTVNPHPVVHVHGSFIHVLWLVSSPSFHHYHPSGHCQSVPHFHACGSILLVNFVLRSRKKEGIPTVCDSMDGTGEYYAKWNKPVGERQIPYDLTFVSFNKPFLKKH